MKIDHIFPFIILFTFFIPWTHLGFTNEIRIKEVIVITLVLIFMFGHLAGKIIYLDYLGKIYLSFILLCIVYTIFQLSNLETIEEIYFLIHVLILTILNFSIYFVISNINLKNFNFKRFINTIVIIYISVFFYFIIYTTEINILAKESLRGFHTIENELLQDNKIKTYMAGTNGSAWFFLLISSFLSGYFINKKNYFFAFMPIIMSLAISYLMLSRGAILFGLILLIFYLLSFIKLNKLKKIHKSIIILLVLTSSIWYFISILQSKNSSITNVFEYKKGLSNRDILVYESLDLTINSYFVGRGFNFIQMNKEELRDEGYNQLSSNNAQNSLLTIFVELGIVGIILFLSFFIMLYLEFTKFIKRSKFSIYKDFLNGVRFLIIFLFFGFFFSHSLEKDFNVFPIYMILIALAVNMKNFNDRKLN